MGVVDSCTGVFDICTIVVVMRTGVVDFCTNVFGSCTGCTDDASTGSVADSAMCGSLEASIACTRCECDIM